MCPNVIEGNAVRERAGATDFQAIIKDIKQSLSTGETIIAMSHSIDNGFAQGRAGILINILLTRRLNMGR